MRAVRVIEAGMFSTVQDLGRPGFAALGVPPGGAADTVSVRLGNRLVGNSGGAAAIEMTLTGGTFAFEQSALVALTGARVHANIEGVGTEARPCRGWEAVRVRAGERLRVGAMERGARAYLCVAGGVRVALRMGSASTLPSAGFGGLEGRPLRGDDRIEIGESSETEERRVIGEEGSVLAREVLERRTVRVVPGGHAALFDAASRQRFWESEFSVGVQSDRIGLRMDGPAVAPPLRGRMASEGMMWGAVQVPEDGRPIVLMCDHPTTGGYPVIATVATVDLPVLGQLRPHDAVRFEEITVERAWALLLAQQHRVYAGVPEP